MSYRELANYINQLITEDFTHNSPEEIHDRCIEVSSRYNGLEEKGRFENLYNMQLLQRLSMIGEKCIEFERQIVQEIRSFNPHFSQNFDEYISYFEISKQISTNFEETTPNLESRFHSLIIPEDLCHYDATPNIIPLQVTDSCDKFRKFYRLTKLTNDLEVNNYLSFCSLNLTFPTIKKAYTVRANFYTTTILLSLSENKLTFARIVELLGCDKKYVSKLIKQLHWLKLIKRIGESAALRDDDVFYINPKYKGTKKHIYIQPIIPNVEQ